MSGRLKTAVLASLGSLVAAIAPATAQSAPTALARDGAHDFDFNLGVWHSHITRTPDPFGAPDAKFEMDGRVNVRRIWNGKAAVEEIEADGPKGHWQGMTLFVYNPGSKQWSQTFANSAEGVLQPPLVGSFSKGRGELYSQDTVKGRSVLIRGTWTIANANEHRYEEAYSQDGGRTWLNGFSGELTRIAAQVPAELPPSEWSIDYDSLDRGRDDECLQRSTSPRRSSASCVKWRSCWAKAARPPRHAGGSRSASRPTTGGARSMVA